MWVYSWEGEYLGGPPHLEVHNLKEQHVMRVVDSHFRSMSSVSLPIYFPLQYRDKWKVHMPLTRLWQTLLFSVGIYFPLTKPRDVTKGEYKLIKMGILQSTPGWTSQRNERSCTQNEMYKNVPGSFISNSPNLETTQMSMNSRVQENTIYKILYGNEKGQTTDIVWMHLRETV